MDELVRGYHVIERVTVIRGWLYALLSSCPMNRGEVFGRLTGGKASPTEDRRKAASSKRTAILFTFSIPESWCLSPTLLSRAKRGKLRFDERYDVSASSRRKSRSKEFLDQPRPS
jgi:hypothetical protein